MSLEPRHTTLCLVICFSLNACGIKGPLYIPEKQYPQNTDKKVPAPKIPSEKQPRDDVVPGS